MTNNSSTNSVGFIPTEEITGIQYMFYSTIVVVGLIGNSLVCKAILSHRRRRPNEYFILNLAVTDLGTCGLSVPLDMVEQISKRFPLGAFLCRVVYPLQTVFMSTSVFTLLCLSIERYKAIVLPLQPKLRCHTAKFMLMATWVISIGVVTPYISVLEYNTKSQECFENWPNDPSYVKAYTFSVFVLLYLIPLSVITICYSRVLFRLYQDKANIFNLMGGKRRSHSEKLLRKRAEQNLRMVKLFVTAVAAFAICLLPFHVLWLWNDFGNGNAYRHFNILMVFSNILAYSNSVINPFIFGKIELRRCCDGGNWGSRRFFSLRSNTTGSSYDTSSFRRSSRFLPYLPTRRYSKGCSSATQTLAPSGSKV